MKQNMGLKTKLLFLFTGVFLAYLSTPLIYINRLKLKKFIGKANSITFLFNTDLATEPENFPWFIPSNHHKIKSSDDLEITRKNLKELIIAKENYVVNSISNFRDSRYDNISNLSGITFINVKNLKGIDSKVHFFNPKESNNKLVIFHQGHGGDFFQSIDAISYFINEGYSVIAFQMPLLGSNPKVKTPRRKLYVANHNFLVQFNTYKKSFISYFISPVVVALDYILENQKFDSISMTGLSGGGWTTVLAAAVDNRIDFSFPVAGSLPLDLNTSDRSDIEYWYKSFYEKFPYLDLYLLGSTGTNRKQTQINFLNDPCCFSGGRSILYSDYMKNLSQKYNGYFNTKIIKDDVHEFTMETAEFINRQIKEWSK